MIIKNLKKIDKKISHFFIFLIKIYQKTFSPDHSSAGKFFPFQGCKYFPSCSMYAILVLEKNGFLFGVPKILWRIIRCNPFSKGGVDFP